MNELNQNSILKPDILIPYNIDYHNHLPIALVYVRPGTNKLNYEKAILLGVQPFGKVVYLSNLNGRIFIKDALIIDHYSTQYYFTIYAKKAIQKFPEMVEKFETHFQIKMEDAKIIGAFDAQINLGMTQEQLFDTFTSEKDFKKMYGQTIKKIKDFYVVNYDIPAIINKYTPESDVFVIAIELENKNIDFHELNQQIFETLKSNIRTPIIDEEKYTEHEWYEKVKRTYHISQNHVASMFDMVDFVFLSDDKHVRFGDIPLGRMIIEKGVLTEDELYRLKYFNIVYLGQRDGSRKLVDIQQEAFGLNMEETCELLSRIDKSTIWNSNLYYCG